MAKISGAKEYIYEEAVDHNSPLSEDLMKRIGASINYINDNSTFQLGDIIPSALTESQFQSIRGNNWVKFDGQDISGSDFSNLTGINTLPLQYDGGSLIQAAGTIDLLDTDLGDNKSHRHSMYRYSDDGTGSSRFFAKAGGYDEYDTDTSYTVIDTDYNGYPMIIDQGGTINKAAGVRINFFIKINNEPT